MYTEAVQINFVMDIACWRRADYQIRELSRLVHFDACIVDLKIFCRLNQETWWVLMKIVVHQVAYDSLSLLYISNAGVISLLSFHWEYILDEHEKMKKG